MEELLNRYEGYFGFRYTVAELYAQYTQGELLLDDKDENTLLAAMEAQA